MVLGLVLLGCSSAWAAQGVQETAPAAATPSGQLDDISAVRQIVSLEMRREGTLRSIEIASSGPVIWTSFRDSSGRLVLELPNAEPAESVASLNLSDDLVKSAVISVAAAGERPLSRLVIETAHRVEHAVIPRGERLVVELSPVDSEFSTALASNTGTTELELARAALFQGSGTPDEPQFGEAPSGVPATQLQGVDVTTGDDTTTIWIAGDGSFYYSTFSLAEPYRFVVDLIGVVNTSPVSTIAVQGQLVDGVRVAQYKPQPELVSRVVVDLVDLSSPEVEATPDGLKVTFRAVDQMAEAAAPSESLDTAMDSEEVAEAMPEVTTAETPVDAMEDGAEADALEQMVEESVGDEVAEVESYEAELETETAEVVEEMVEETSSEATEYVAEAVEAVEVASAEPDSGTSYEVEQEMEPVQPAEPAEPAEMAQPVQMAQIDQPAEPVPPAPIEEVEVLDEPQWAPARDDVMAEPVIEEASAQRESWETELATEDEPVEETTSGSIFEVSMDLTPEVSAEPSAFGAREVSVTGGTVYTGEPMTLTLKDADIKDVLRSFAQISGLNVVVQPGVTGTVTVEFTDVPWDQALDQILKINGLGYELEGNIMRVAPVVILRQEAEERARLEAAKALAIPLKTILRRVSYATALDVASILTGTGGGASSLLSARGSVIVDNRTNTLIIKELPTQIDTVIAVIENLDIPEPQVTIEARIIETTKRFSRTLGIQWGFSGIANAERGNTTGLVFPNNGTADGGVNLLTGGANGFIDLTLGNVLNTFNLDILLQAAESEGLINILSAPRITTLNNEQASIQSGLQIPIQTIANNTVSVQFVNATLRLDVTPHVTAEGTVLMDIDIQKREPQLAFAVVGASNAPISTKDASTRVIVRDGGTTVIGGLYEVTSDQGEDRVPGLSNVPILKHLFKNKRRNDENEELLIFITPRVVKL